MPFRPYPQIGEQINQTLVPIANMRLKAAENEAAQRAALAREDRQNQLGEGRIRLQAGLKHYYDEQDRLGLAKSLVNYGFTPEEADAISYNNPDMQREIIRRKYPNAQTPVETPSQGEYTNPPVARQPVVKSPKAPKPANPPIVKPVNYSNIAKIQGQIDALNLENQQLPAYLNDDGSVTPEAAKEGYTPEILNNFFIQNRSRIQILQQALQQAQGGNDGGGDEQTLQGDERANYNHLVNVKGYSPEEAMQIVIQHRGQQ